ncbi:MAG: DNA adenine methylase [Muribaculaceae bacterium]|nr:DNA adenine methylase [Muribaculaceae bacterium]
MEYNFKTLNYLGSKLRLLNFIEDNVLRITNKGQGVCDLFAGSGCVSYKLSNHFSVTSCDIQSYSKSICNALLKKHVVSENDIDKFISDIQVDHELFNCFDPLIITEEQAIKTKNLEVLSEILENGSVEVFRLENKWSLLNNQLQKVSTNLNNTALLNEKSLISRYYGGVYFSYRQAVWIDVILEEIHKNISKENRDLYLAALLSTASDIADTVGKHFAQPIKSRDSNGNIKNTVYNKALKDKTIDVIKLYRNWLIRYISTPRTRYHFHTTQSDYLECLQNLPNSVKTIYADPPYTRDHYSRYYHVLETITLRDSPELSTTNIHGKRHISNGIYRKDRHQSPFCIKSKAPETFKAMFKIISNSGRNLLLSYSPYDESKKSHPRVVTMQQLLIWAKNYFNHVDVVSAGSFKHSKLNSIDHSLDASNEAEVLIVCTNE